MNNPLHYARYWRELYKTLDGLRSNPQMAAHYLSFHRDQMVESKGRLLSMGMDISDINDPTVVPIPLKRHPRTEPEKREFEAQVEFLIDLHFLAFAVTAAGANIVYSAVGDEPLIEVLSGNVEGYPREVSRAEVSSWISKTNLEYLAVACALWLLEPVGEMKEEVSRIDAAAWKRMLYATEIVTLNKVSQNIDEDRSGEKQRALAADAMTGWALSNISLGGQAGGRLRRALGAETPKGMQYARLLEELPGAMLQAWGIARPKNL